MGFLGSRAPACHCRLCQQAPVYTDCDSREARGKWKRIILGTAFCTFQGRFTLMSLLDPCNKPVRNAEQTVSSTVSGDSSGLTVAGKFP